LRSDGFPLGFVEGMSDGLVDGFKLGSIEGEEDGRREGAELGVRLGSSEGVQDGFKDGASLTEGLKLGTLGQLPHEKGHSSETPT